MIIIFNKKLLLPLMVFGLLITPSFVEAIISQIIASNHVYFAMSYQPVCKTISQMVTMKPGWMEELEFYFSIISIKSNCLAIKPLYKPCLVEQSLVISDKAVEQSSVFHQHMPLICASTLIVAYVCYRWYNHTPIMSEIKPS